jgi:hypothetical protein
VHPITSEQGSSGMHTHPTWRSCYLL